MNTLVAAASLFTGVPVYAVVGGFHLLKADALRIKKSIAYLKKLDLSAVMSGHCTGFDALCALRRAFAERFQRLEVGARYTI